VVDQVVVGTAIVWCTMVVMILASNTHMVDRAEYMEI